MKTFTARGVFIYLIVLALTREINIYDSVVTVYCQFMLLPSTFDNNIAKKEKIIENKQLTTFAF